MIKKIKLLREFIQNELYFPQNNLPKKNLTLYSYPNNKKNIIVQVCTTNDEISKGLMFRKNILSDNEGMLFCMKNRIKHSFWMKNTHIPLDILFIDYNGIIIGIIENVEPYSLEGRSVNNPSTHVLEVNAGFCNKHNIKIGDIIK
jgi:uncharacterized membrane protein (UPF0127 family)